MDLHAVDITEREAVRRVIAHAEDSYGPIDVLVVNAGIGENTVVEEFDDVEAAEILDVNLRSTVFAIGAVLPAMVARKAGQIVGVSSIAAYRGMPGAAVYCASKAGFSTLLEGLRVDLKRHGVAVTTVSPGFVRTPMTDRNNHAMPWLLEVDDAVRRILHGVDRRRREVRFPWPLATVGRVVRAMPAWLYEFFASGYSRPKSSRADSRGSDRAEAT